MGTSRMKTAVTKCIINHPRAYCHVFIYLLKDIPCDCWQLLVYMYGRLTTRTYFFVNMLAIFWNIGSCIMFMMVGSDMSLAMSGPPLPD